MTAEVQPRNIRLRRKRGQKIWDGDVLHLRRGIIEDNGRFRIDLCRGTYFQYVSLVDSLTREAVSCTRSRRTRPVFRDAVAGSLEDLQSGRPQAQLLGFAVAFLFATPTGRQVLIQRRSFETGVAADLHALVPAYVNELIEEDGQALVSPLQDFFREVSEELYADRHQADEHLIRRDWYMENGDVKRLRALHRDGKLVFEIVGFGFDAMLTDQYHH